MLYSLQTLCQIIKRAKPFKHKLACTGQWFRYGWSIKFIMDARPLITGELTRILSAIYENSWQIPANYNTLEEYKNDLGAVITGLFSYKVDKEGFHKAIKLFDTMFYNLWEEPQIEAQPLDIDEIG